ncbi:hypothetical protein P8C59_000688 [Phyllachora maydis]|uniref:Uncharacterized protein n=1 Tax=Phyllachora maydis TaxID=1825666 RepID=A0AAD9HXR4_9PEZI|nr:hypothetical protein P8C59_000688 [Phyllachora maydis]
MLIMHSLDAYHWPMGLSEQLPADMDGHGANNERPGRIQEIECRCFVALLFEIKELQLSSDVIELLLSNRRLVQVQRSSYMPDNVLSASGLLVCARPYDVL